MTTTKRIEKEIENKGYYTITLDSNTYTKYKSVFDFFNNSPRYNYKHTRVLTTNYVRIQITKQL